MSARGILPSRKGHRADVQTLLKASRSSGPRGDAIWCGGVLPGGGASSNLLGHGVVDLLPMALIGLLLLAATIWMVRRWGARPPVLPPGVSPPSPPAAEPRAGELPARPPVPAARPAGTGIPLTS